MLKNVLPYISEAQAFAKYVLPVPGGPYSNIPFQGFLDPVNIYGNLNGIITASFNAYFALVKPATSSHLTSGFSEMIASASLCCKVSLSFFASLLASIFLGYLPSLFLI